MPWITDPHIWISLFTLTALEIVLGIDNIIFISILAGKLPEPQQPKARTMGLMIALVTRVLLLCSIFWLTRLTSDLFAVMGHGFSGKDLVLICGGLFLLWKSVHEIHGNVEGEGDHGHGAVEPVEKTDGKMAVSTSHATATGLKNPSRKAVTLSSVIAQIVVIDIVFSLDSVITAVGMAQHIGVMIAAVILAMGVMLAASGAISNYVNRHPTIKMLALSFLLLVGVVLVADGFGQHVEKGYIYFAMAFSFAVEILNIRARTKRQAAAAEAQPAAES
jgi:predicted tellurium resistance membrane protein TerC